MHAAASPAENATPARLIHPQPPVAVIHSGFTSLSGGGELVLSVSATGHGAQATWFPGSEVVAARGHIIDAFLDLWQQHRDTGLLLYISDSTVRGLLKEQLDSFPGLVIREVIAGERLRDTWDRCLSAHRAEELSREPAPVEKQRPPLMVVATDASRQKRGKSTGIAAVGSDGRVRMGSMEALSILAGEFSAVEMALKSWGRAADCLWILTDSQAVSHFLNARIGSGCRKGMASQDGCLRKIRELERQGIEVRISWVRGHDEHLLNTYADRAAVAARRCAEFKLANRAEFAERLRAELQEVLLGVPVEQLRTHRISAGETAVTGVR
ncbi:RNase H family protein [Corynebacterium sp. A21]|uniref:RNase H family protein n=1 Tax=Corynebacterium sp. A21 TaxID=3457318 RepID=UPI003FCF0F26